MGRVTQKNKCRGRTKSCHLKGIGYLLLKACTKMFIVAPSTRPDPTEPQCSEMLSIARWRHINKKIFSACRTCCRTPECLQVNGISCKCSTRPAWDADLFAQALLSEVQRRVQSATC